MRGFDADIVVVPESWREHDGRGIVDELAGDGYQIETLEFATLDISPRRAKHAVPGEGHWELVVLTRYPVVARRELPLGRIPGDQAGPRSALSCTLDVDGVEVDLVAVHVSSRVWQLAPVRHFARAATAAAAARPDRDHCRRLQLLGSARRGDTARLATRRPRAHLSGAPTAQPDRPCAGPRRRHGAVGRGARGDAVGPPSRAGSTAASTPVTAPVTAEPSATVSSMPEQVAHASRGVPEAQLVRPRTPVIKRFRRIVAYRELLVGMTRKELKVKYKNSVLGFAWSLLNPLLYLVVFYIAFQLILGTAVPGFPIFLLSGLLVWNLFSTGLAGASGSVVANAGLVKKVSFPREILPLAAVGSMLVHFFLQSLVLFAVLAIVRWDVAWAYVPLMPVALVALLLLTGAFGILPERGQRVPPRHAALPRARAARVVLDDADRLRLHDDPEPREVGGQALHGQPGHPDRARVPAGDLRQGRQHEDSARLAGARDPAALGLDRLRRVPRLFVRGRASWCSRSRSGSSAGARRTSPRSCSGRRDRGPARRRSTSASTTSTTPR